ncbi:MAG: metallophosphoesterase [Balneolaceae bacterium]
MAGFSPTTQLFLSDVHLRAGSFSNRPDPEPSLLALIDFCETKQIRITVLGDLFDYWIEYPGWSPPFGERVLGRFEEYHNCMGPSLYITGNHDHRTMGRLQDAGFDVEKEYRYITHDGYRFFIHHGDGLQDPAMGLKRSGLNRFLSSETVMRTYRRLLPPGAGLRFMKGFSSLCRIRPTDGPERLDVWSEKYLGNSSADFIISGHDHIPRVRSMAGGIYANPGAFYKDKTVALYTNERISIVVWDYRENRLLPLTPSMEIAGKKMAR